MFYKKHCRCNDVRVFIYEKMYFSNYCISNVDNRLQKFLDIDKTKKQIDFIVVKLINIIV